VYRLAYDPSSKVTLVQSDFMVLDIEKSRDIDKSVIDLYEQSLDLIIFETNIRILFDYYI
jgi:hypothetical protein